MPSAADSDTTRNLSKWFNSIKQNKDTKTIKKPNLTNVTKRQQATCPYCDSNLNLADGQWDSKHCTTCKKTVKPYGKPQ